MTKTTTTTTTMKNAFRRYRYGCQGTSFIHSHSLTSQNHPPNDLENRESFTYITSDFNRMLKSQPLPSIFEFCKVFTKLSKLGLHSEVLSLYREMASSPVRVPVDSFTFNVVINSCCSVGSDYGLSLCGAMVKNGFEPDTVTFTHLVKGLFSEERYSEACRLLNVLNKTGQPLPPIFFLGKVLTNMSKMGQYSKVLSLYREMSVNSVPLSLFMYNVVIDSCCRLGNGAGYGSSLIGAIVKHGYQPDARTFTHLIKGLVLEGRSDDALTLFRTSTKCCKPDVFTYGIVIDGLCKEGNVSMAIELLRDMKVQSCDPNTVIYAAVLDGLFKLGRVDLILSLVGEMIKEGVVPDKLTFDNLVKGLFLAGSDNAALKLFYGLPKVFSGAVLANVVTYSIVINGLCREGFVEEAKELLAKMEENGVLPNVVTYGIVIKGLCAMGKLQDAWELFNDLATTKGIEPNVITYTIMIHGLCQEGFLEEAKELLAKMEENGCKPDDVTFNTIVSGLLKWNQITEAMELIKTMVDRKFSPSASSMSMVVNILGPNEIMK